MKNPYLIAVFAACVILVAMFNFRRLGYKSGKHDGSIETMRMLPSIVAATRYEAYESIYRSSGLNMSREQAQILQSLASSAHSEFLKHYDESELKSPTYRAFVADIPKVPFTIDEPPTE